MIYSLMCPFVIHKLHSRNMKKENQAGIQFYNNMQIHSEKFPYLAENP